MFERDPRHVDEILAQFPGPVRLTPSPTKWLAVFACWLAFGALIVTMLVRDPSIAAKPSLYYFGWFVVASCAVRIIIAIGHLVPGVTYLVVGKDGFEIKNLLRHGHDAWHSTTSFEADELMRFQWIPYGQHVGFDQPGLGTGPERKLRRYYRGILDDFGLSYKELARLMNEWRAKAVGAPTPQPD